MPKEHTATIANGLTQQLKASEAAIDNSIKETAQLIETAINARSAAGLSSTVGGSVITHAVTTLQKLQSAQDSMTAAHRDLAALGKAMKIDTTAVIPLGDKPDREDDPARPKAREAAEV